LTEIAFENENMEFGPILLWWAGRYPLETSIELREVNRYLDLLVIYENGQVSIMSPVWPPNNRQDFFCRHGNYFLSIVLGGHGSVPLPPFRLKLGLTGDWQTSTMEPI
jgi:hypothetical protein